MKHLTVLLFVLIPFISFAQKKESWWSRGREQQKAENEQFRNPIVFNNSVEEGGFHVQRAGAFLLGGTAGELLGTAIIVSGAGNGDAAITAGSILVGAGVILQVVGYTQLLKGGAILRKVKFTGNGLSFNF